MLMIVLALVGIAALSAFGVFQTLESFMRFLLLLAFAPILFLLNPRGFIKSLTQQ